jgi:hypothetical protein
MDLARMEASQVEELSYWAEDAVGKHKDLPTKMDMGEAPGVGGVGAA